MKALARRAVSGRLAMGGNTSGMVDDIAAALWAHARFDSTEVAEVAASLLADLCYLAALGICPLSRSAPRAVALAREHVARGGRVAL